MKALIFLKGLIIYFFPSLALISSIVITGCTTVHKNFKPFIPAQENQVKTQAKVAVLLPDGLCSLFYKPRDFQEFLLGPVACDNAKIAAKAIFTESLFIL